MINKIVSNKDTKDHPIYKRIRDKYPDIEIVGEYTGARGKVLCRDKYGEFLLDINLHIYNNRQYTFLSAVNKSLYWGNYAKDKTDSEYDYSKVDYKGNKTKVILICNSHGDFSVNPNDHLTKKSGCPSCRSSKISFSKIKTTEDFIKEATEVHKGKYDYSKTIYKGSKKPISIVCPIHGESTMKAGNHLSSSGCNECGKEMNRGVYNVTIAKRDILYYKSTKAYVYIIRCFNDKESFYKVGITKHRINRYYAIPYSVEEIHIIDTNLLYAVFLEKNLKNKLSKYRYKPLKLFGGHTECFTNINKIKLHE